MCLDLVNHMLALVLGLQVCFVFKGNCDHRALHGLTHSFPTRRASDLAVRLTPALALGTWSGEWLFRRTEGRNYRPAALAVLLVIGAMATARALWGQIGRAHV